MRCIVTGVAGFIGSHLAERLLADGHEVRGIDNFVDYYPRQIKEKNLQKSLASQRFSFIEGDLLTMNMHLDNVDWIFHLAAQPGVRASWGKDFVRYTDCNILVTQRLLELARDLKDLKRFVYASSSSVYGDAHVLPLAESALPRPLSPYGVTKLAAEHLCKLYYENFKLPAVSLRYFTVYGPRQRPDMAFHCFCKALIEARPVHIYGDGEQSRDFTYISDIVEATVLAATEERASGKVLNIAGGVRASIYQAVKLLEEISGLSASIVVKDKQHGDVRHTCAATTRAEQILGYHPKVSLREGLTKEFQYMLALYGCEKRTTA